MGKFTKRHPPSLLIALVLMALAGCQADPTETLRPRSLNVIPSAHAQFPTGCCSASSTGSATAANQTLEIAQLTAINGKMPTVGQKTMAASAPVVFASDQSPLTCNIGTIGTLATAAKQDTGNTSLGSIDTRLSSQATAANQSTAQTSLSSIDTKLTSQATAANQTTANSSLSSIDGKTPALVGGRQPVDGSGVTQPVSGTFWQATQPVSSAASSQSDGHSANIGALADASSASTLTGLLKAIKALLAGGLPSALVSNRLDTNTGAWMGSTAPTVGSKTGANSIPVVIASDQGAVATAGATPTTSAVALTTTGSQVFASTSSVKARKIYNRAANPIVWCVYYDGVTNVTSEATAGFAIQAGQTWEMPSFAGIVEYTGVVRCTTASSTGSVQATQVL